MQHKDEHLQTILKKATEDIHFSTLQKERLKQNMLKELGQQRLNLWQKIAAIITTFWETTYEISLAPVAISLGVVLLVAGSTFYGYYISPEMASFKNPQSQTLYLQQTATNPDGGMQVVYIPVKRGS